MSDTDDFLAHYGVKGMKWGKRHRKENRAILKTAGQERINNSGGSKVKANWKSIGKLAAVTAVSNVGAHTVSALAKGNPNVAMGAQLVAGAIQIGALGKTINEIRAVNEASRDD